MVVIPAGAEVRNAWRSPGPGPIAKMRITFAIQGAIRAATADGKLSAANTVVQFPIVDSARPHEQVTIPEDIAVPPLGAKIFWGVHAEHAAAHPGLSPFVHASGRLSDQLTMELHRTRSGQTMVTRIYPGAYRPPLPWMSSASAATGGVAACREFWRRHAFTYRPGVFRETVGQVAPPDWFAEKD